MGDIRKQIAGDRRHARMAAATASLVSATLVAISVWALYTSVAGLVSYPSQADAGVYAYVAAAMLATIASVVLLIWTYRSARNASMRQRVQAMWLRRFQREAGTAFRTSHVIDQLSQHGISTITLQDRDVKISFAQRRNRALSIAWRVLTPTIGLVGVVGVFVVAIFLQRDLTDLQSGLGGALLLLGFYVGGSALLFAGAILALAGAAISGPVQTFFRRSSDDYHRLPRLVERIRTGRRTRGTEILRISDDRWRDAVSTALSVVDVVIVDVSSWSDSLAWELREVSKICSPRAAVFICREGVDGVPIEAAAIMGNVTGDTSSSRIAWYPVSSHDSAAADRFAIALRERVYSAMDTL